MNQSKCCYLSFLFVFFFLILAVPWILQASQYDPTAPKDSFSNSMGMTFVTIQPGTFLMGSTMNLNVPKQERLQQKVIRNAFQIQTTEVTQGQWVAVMGKNPAYYTDCGEDCPVERINREQIIVFMAKLNASIKDGGIYRLPTEVEWEYAAKAGMLTEFYWGDKGDCLKANYGYNNTFICPPCQGREICTQTNPGTPTPVKSYPPNPWGLYDMHGNVSEVCRNDANGKAEWVAKGGHFFLLSHECRAAYRRVLGIDQKSGSRGFRLVRILNNASPQPQLDDKTAKQMILKHKQAVTEKLIKDREAAAQDIFEVIRNKKTTDALLLLSKNPNLVHKKNRFGSTPLALASSTGQVSIVSQLLKLGADVNAQSNQYQTPLHLAVFNDRFEAAKLLLENGADPNMMSNSSPRWDKIKPGTPLHLAALKGNKDMASLLITYGARINVRNQVAETPLHYAARKGKPHLFVLLVSKGANVNFKNSSGQTPLQVAIENGYKKTFMTVLEKQNQVQIEVQEDPGELFYYIHESTVAPKRKSSLKKARELLSAHPKWAFAKDKTNNTPLHSAVFYSTSEIINLLLSMGVDINARNNRNEIPLHNAGNPKTLGQLINKGADINAQDFKGQTLLHRIADFSDHNQYQLMIHTLIQAGAKISIKDNSGFTPANIAQEEGNHKLFEILTSN